MLVLGRKRGERVVIGSNVEVVVLDCGHNKVRLGVEAAPEIRVNRDEVQRRIEKSASSTGNSSADKKIQQQDIPNVLVIDDDEIDRRRVHRWLGDTFVVIDAETECQARDLSGKQSPDCVLLDHHIPGTDSMKLLRHFVAHAIPVVMYTGHGSEHLAVSAMQAGADDYVVKNGHDRYKLQQAIKSAIRRGQVRSAVACRRRQLRDVCGGSLDTQSV